MAQRLGAPATSAEDLNSVPKLGSSQLPVASGSEAPDTLFWTGICIHVRILRLPPPPYIKSNLKTMYACTHAQDPGSVLSTRIWQLKTAWHPSSRGI